jgi:hypothetical protein
VYKTNIPHKHARQHGPDHWHIVDMEEPVVHITPLKSTLQTTHPDSRAKQARLLALSKEKEQQRRDELHAYAQHGLYIEPRPTHERYGPTPHLPTDYNDPSIIYAFGKEKIPCSCTTCNISQLVLVNSPPPPPLLFPSRSLLPTRAPLDTNGLTCRCPFPRIILNLTA